MSDAAHMGGVGVRTHAVCDHLEEIRDETGYSVPAGVAEEIASLVERLR